MAWHDREPVTTIKIAAGFQTHDVLPPPLSSRLSSPPAFVNRVDQFRYSSISTGIALVLRSFTHMVV